MCDTTTLKQYIHRDTKGKCKRGYCPYLITITKHQKLDYVTSSEIGEVLLYLENHGIKVYHGRLERHGRYGQMHFHGSVFLPDYIRYKKYTRYNGFRIHYRYVKSRLHTMRYIDKHYSPYTHTELDTILGNYFAYHYAF